MNKIKKGLVTLISCLLVATYALPVAAEDEVEKKESVYTVLNTDGSVKSITVSDTLHSDSGFSDYKDTSDLSNVQNLKSNDEVVSTSGGYVWNTTDTDIYYQGTSTKDLPLATSISYKLDGTAYTADELVGKSGHLVITIKVSNSLNRTYTVNGKTYNLVTPFVVGLGGMFDEDVFKNVKVSSGKVTSDSSHSIVAGVMLPGLKKGLSQVLDSDLMHKLEDYLVDEVTIESDVENFESPTMMLAAATSTDDLKEEFSDIDELSSIFDQLDDLKEATQELIDGTQSLYDGAVKLNDGVSTLKDGANTLNSGASTLYDGANQVSAGASELSSGLAQLVGNNNDLVSGVNQLADAVLKTANETLAANETIKNDPKYAELTWSNYASQLSYYYGVTDAMREAALSQIKDKLTKAGYSLSDEQINMVIYMAAKAGASDLEAYMKENAGSLTTAANVQQAQKDAALIGTGDFSKVDRALTLATYEGAVGTVQSAVKTATKTEESEGTSLTVRQAEEVLKIAAENGITDFSNVPPEQLDAIVKTVLDSISSDEKALGVDDQTMASIVAGLRNAQGNANVYSQLSATLKAQSESLTDEEIAVLLTEGSQYHSSATTVSDMITAVQSDVGIANVIAANLASSQTDEGKQIIKSYLNKLVEVSSDSIESLKNLESQLNDVAKLKSGIKDYTDGVSKCYAGSKTLSSGASQVSSGSKQLKEGTDSLVSGINTLKDGSNTLMEGAKTLNEGMQKYNAEGISKLTDNSRISSIEEASDLLSAIMNDSDNYSNYSGISDGTTGSIKFIFKVSSAAKKASDDSSESTTEKTSFWQRIINLFNFSK